MTGLSLLQHHLLGAGGGPEDPSHQCLKGPTLASSDKPGHSEGDGIQTRQLKNSLASRLLSFTRGTP